MSQSNLQTEAEANFVQHMREEREKRRWTQERLARELRHRTRVALHPTGIARLETGDKRLLLKEAVAIADTLGLTLQEMVEPGDPEARLRAEVADMWTRLLRGGESVEAAVADFAELVSEAEALEPDARRFAAESTSPEPDNDSWGQGFLELLRSARRTRRGLSKAFEGAR